MILKALLDILFPPLCHGCREFIPDAGELHLCMDCRKTSPLLNSPCCPVCGMPFLTEGGIEHRCSDCISKPPPFAAARGAVLYAGAVRDLVHRFKYGGKVQHCRPLALLAAGHLAAFAKDCRADCIMPVPLHRKRLRQRGFNQAVLLGNILAKKWHLPHSRYNLRRIRWTEPQIQLTARERRENVAGAFAVRDASAIRSRRIILIDDVFTTGSTAAECARTLSGAGAEAVFVVTVARAMV